MEKRKMSGVGIVLGERYRDTLHGTEGVATAFTHYLTGCSRVTLEWVKEGEIKREWFDETMVEAVGKPTPVDAHGQSEPTQVGPPPANKKGGPRAVEPSRDPSRG